MIKLVIMRSRMERKAKHGIPGSPPLFGPDFPSPGANGNATPSPIDLTGTSDYSEPVPGPSRKNDSNCSVDTRLHKNSTKEASTPSHTAGPTDESDSDDSKHNFVPSPDNLYPTPTPFQSPNRFTLPTNPYAPVVSSLDDAEGYTVQYLYETLSSFTENDDHSSPRSTTSSSSERSSADSEEPSTTQNRGQKRETTTYPTYSVAKRHDADYNLVYVFRKRDS